MAREDVRGDGLSRRVVLRGASGLAIAAWPACLARGAGGEGDEGGFVSLFDGESLAGWHTNREKTPHGTGGRWAVEDGVLTGEQDPPGSGNGGVLLTDRRFGDFELRLDMKPDWGPDSGVFLRCAEDGSCLQMYVDYHNNGNVGHLAGEGRVRCPMKPFRIHPRFGENDRLVGFTTSPDPRRPSWGSDIYEHSCTPEQWLAAWRVGEWNEARVRCVGRGPRITTWINGTKVCVFDGVRTGHKRYDAQKVRRVLGDDGSIGLQVHGGAGWPAGAKCRWRRIRVKPL